MFAGLGIQDEHFAYYISGGHMMNLFEPRAVQET